MVKIDELKKKFGDKNIDKDGNLIYPINISSKENYEKWLEVMILYENARTNSKIKTSGNFVVNINASRPGKIQREIADLPAQEKIYIMQRWKELVRLRGKSIGLKAHLFKKPPLPRPEKINEPLQQREIEIISLFSKLYSVEEVWKIVNNQLGIKATKKAIFHFRTLHAEEIRVAQEKYKESFDGIRLVHKRSRLEELLDLYNDRREIYQNKKGANDYRLLLVTLEQIRKEVEGERVTVDANLQIKIEHTINLQQEELLRDLPIKTMIISMVAGRIGINPIQLLTRLTNSYYSRFNGMSPTTAMFNSSDITYPSQLVYSLDEIKALSIEKTESNNKLAEYEEIKDKEAEFLTDIKGSILERLRAKKQELKNRKSETEAIDEKSFKETFLFGDGSSKNITSYPPKK